MKGQKTVGFNLQNTLALGWLKNLQEKAISSTVAVVIIIVFAIASVGGYVLISGGDGAPGGGGPSPQENLPSAYHLDVPHVGDSSGI